MKKEFEQHAIVAQSHDPVVPVHYYRVRGDTPNYWFSATFVPGAIMVAGDCGALVFDIPAERDTFRWLMSSLDSPEYVLSKIDQRINAKKFSQEKTQAFLTRALEEQKEGGGNPEIEADIQDALEQLGRGVFTDADEFFLYLRDEAVEGWAPLDDLPDVVDYTDSVYTILAGLIHLRGLIAERDSHKNHFHDTVCVAYREGVKNRANILPYALDRFLNGFSTPILEEAKKGDKPYWEILWESKLARDLSSEKTHSGKELYEVMFERGIDATEHKGFVISRRREPATQPGDYGLVGLRVAWAEK